MERKRETSWKVSDNAITGRSVPILPPGCSEHRACLGWAVILPWPNQECLIPDMGWYCNPSFTAKTWLCSHHWLGPVTTPLCCLKRPAMAKVCIIKQSAVRSPPSGFWPWWWSWLEGIRVVALGHVFHRWMDFRVAHPVRFLLLPESTATAGFG